MSSFFHFQLRTSDVGAARASTSRCSAALEPVLEVVRAGGGVVVGPVYLPTGERFAICDDPQGATFAVCS